MSGPGKSGLSAIAQMVSNIDGWLDTMRGSGGYGGPVVHWWQQCLSFTGAGLDWRYEGIIAGYLTLWLRTGEKAWLAKACRAGDDLVRGILPGGNFRNSSFELNPYAGGTPHEAAADLGLLRLASALKADDDERWHRYADTAIRNLSDYYVGRHWDEETESFRDMAGTPSFVPNKACTLAEALFAWAELDEDDRIVQQYALPTLKAVVNLQIEEPARLRGAIAQNRIENTVINAYFPYYIARCIPALLLAYRWTGADQWLAAARSAALFIMREIDESGHLPQVIYSRGRNCYPQWIAGLGDVLRILDLFQPLGVEFDAGDLEATFLGGGLPSGGMVTARGFAAQISQQYGGHELPDFRDHIAVSGWVDKAFAYLAERLPLGQEVPPPELHKFQVECQIRGRRATWRETTTEMSLCAGELTLYRWQKGQPWAAVVAHEVMWK